MASTIFLGAVISGLLFSGPLGVTVLPFLRQTLSGVAKLNPIFLMLFIFINNSVKSFLAIVLGTLFGIAPALFLLFNGFIIGSLVLELMNVKGLGFILAALLPHGVIELPAVVLSSSIGLRVGYELVRSVRGRGTVKAELQRGVRFFVTRIFPFFLLAAVIEVFVTPFIVQFVG